MCVRLAGRPHFGLVRVCVAGLPPEKSSMWAASRAGTRTPQRTKPRQMVVNEALEAVIERLAPHRHLTLKGTELAEGRGDGHNRSASVKSTACGPCAEHGLSGGATRVPVDGYPTAILRAATEGGRPIGGISSTTANSVARRPQSAQPVCNQVHIQAVFHIVQVGLEISHGLD